jgi:hypothetical protein
MHFVKSRAWTSQLAGAADENALAGGAAAAAMGASAALSGRADEPPKSMLLRPCPIVLPTATEPAVAAICANMPG